MLNTIVGQTYSKTINRNFLYISLIAPSFLFYTDSLLVFHKMCLLRPCYNTFHCYMKMVIWLILKRISQYTLKDYPLLSILYKE